jgi:hypothetical protein
MVEIRAKKKLHRTSFVYGLVTIFKQSFIYFYFLFVFCYNHFLPNVNKQIANQELGSNQHEQTNRLHCKLKALQIIIDNGKINFLL